MLQVGDLGAVLRLDKSQFDKGLGEAEGRFSSFGSSLTGKATAMGSAIGSALATGAVAAGVALAGVATVGVKTFMDIESAAADAASKMDLSAIAQASGKSMEEAFTSVKEHVMSLADELGQLNTNAFDPTQIAQACAELAVGGFDVATASAKDLEPILSLATATTYDLSKSAGLAMSTMNQFGMGVGDLGRISDVYATAAGKSAAGMSDFDYAMQQAGPVAKGVGMSFEELTARISKLADAGYSGEKSGTALRTAMMALTSPTKTQAATLEKLGITYDQIDPRVHTFGETLDLLTAKGADIYDFGEIFGKEGAAIVYSSAQQSAAVKELTAQLENSQGAAGQMAKMMLDNLKGSMDAAMGAASSLTYLIGGKLAPGLKSAFDWFSAEGAPAIRAFIEAIADGDWTKVGDLLTKGVKAGWDKLKDLGSKLLGWLKAVNWGGLGEYVTKGISAAWGELKGLGGQLLGWLKAVDWGGVASSLWESFKSGASTLADFGKSLYDSITSIDWGGIGKDILSSLKRIDFSSIGKSILDSLSNIGTQILGYFNDIRWSDVGYKAGKAIRDAITALSDIGSTLYNYLTSVDWSGAGSSITDKIKNGLTTLKGYWEEFKTGLGAVDFTTAGKELAEKIKVGIGKVVDWAKSIKESITKGLTDWIEGTTLTKLGENAGSLLLKGIGAVIAGTVSGAITLATYLYNAIIEAPKWIAYGLEAIGKFAQGFIHGALTTLADGMALAILTGVKAALSGLSSWNIPGISSWATDQMKPVNDEIAKIEGRLTSLTFIDITPSVDVEMSAEQVNGPTIPENGETRELTVHTTYTSTSGATLATPVLGGKVGYDQGGVTTVGSGANVELSGILDGVRRTSSEMVAYMKSKGYTNQDIRDTLFEFQRQRTAGNIATGQGAGQPVINDAYFKKLGIDQDSVIATEEKKAEIGLQTEEKKAEIGLTTETKKAEIGTTAASASSSTLTLAARTVESILVGGSQAAANAIKLGAQVAAGFSTAGGQAVKIGLDTAGREIAIIGQVAQKQWTDGGNVLYSKVIVAGADFSAKVFSASQATGNAATNFASNVGSAITNFYGKMTTVGTYLQTRLSTSADYLNTKVTSGISNFYTTLKTSVDYSKLKSDTATDYKYKKEIGAADAIDNAATSLNSASSSIRSIMNAAASPNTLPSIMPTSTSTTASKKTTTTTPSSTTWTPATPAVAKPTWPATSGLYGWGMYAGGKETQGPEYALIGEDGKEFVIPTKTKRWDLLLAAMRSYGIRGMAEGGESGSTATEPVDADAMTATFGIVGLANMAKGVQKILNDMKDFFRITWSIIRSEGKIYWKNINLEISNEIDIIRDNGIEAFTEIRTKGLADFLDLKTGILATIGGIWDAMEPSVADISQNMISGFDYTSETIQNAILDMIGNAVGSLQGFATSWAEIWDTMLEDLAAAQTTISAACTEIAAELAKISVTVIINNNGGGGGGNGDYGDLLDTGDYNTNGQYYDPTDPRYDTCGGIPFLQPDASLITTDPFYLNMMQPSYSPSTYTPTTNGQPYQLPAVFRAKGALIDQGPELDIVGESGPEMILPTKLTKLFLNLADRAMGDVAGSRIVIEDHTVHMHEHYWNGRKVTDLVMTTAQRKIQQRGGKSTV